MGAVMRRQQQHNEVRHDDNTSLPQNDPQRTSRLQMLDGARVLYEIDNSDKELPIKVLNLPPEKDFSCRYKVFFVWKAALLLFGTIQVWLSDLIRWFKQLIMPWKAKLSYLDELKQLYKEPDYPEPKYAIAFWKEDWFFAYQRLAGPCPNLIHHCKRIPDRLAVEDIDLTPFGERGGS
ncbi:uncharacterized protein LOC125376166 [Haliotis rufescens]|uniref:uncharacterized protein LOC125376166 n=1 Tax=Haliotis rufescens TaxID=6454 RepID=UPI00201EFBA4|nr:uncharacterized protein LOC125376166 [Haliotis rufescens]